MGRNTQVRWLTPLTWSRTTRRDATAARHPSDMTARGPPTTEDNGATQTKTASATTTVIWSESNRTYLTDSNPAKQAEIPATEDTGSPTAVRVTNITEADTPKRSAHQAASRRRTSSAHLNTVMTADRANNTLPPRPFAHRNQFLDRHSSLAG